MECHAWIGFFPLLLPAGRIVHTLLTTFKKKPYARLKVVSTKRRLERKAYGRLIVRCGRISWRWISPWTRFHFGLVHHGRFIQLTFTSPRFSPSAFGCAVESGNRERCRMLFSWNWPIFYNLQLFYWHFLEILWLFIFLVFYSQSHDLLLLLTPYPLLTTFKVERSGR